MIRTGVIEEVERVGGWQVIQLPVHPTGRIPVKRGMRSLGGVVAWVDGKQRWMRDLAEAGIPVVNCGGDWRDVEGIGSVVVDLPSVLHLAVEHFQELSLKKVYYFGHKVSSDSRRQGALKVFRKIAAGVGIEVASLETRGKNPDENLERLLAPQSEQKLIEQFASLEGSLGLFAENDYFARLACNTAVRAGKRVPADLAILGAAGDLLGRFGSPTISTVPFPGVDVGKEAFRIIDNAHRGTPIPAKAIQVKATSIIVRESTGGKARDIAMERVSRWIERESLRGLTVQELSEVAGMSLKALRRRYKLVYGEEPSEHIRRVRLGEAKRRLRSTGEAVSEIAVACGFTSQAAFYNYFLRHEAVSPSEYRKEAGVWDGQGEGDASSGQTVAARLPVPRD